MAGLFNYSKAGKGINKEDLEKSGIALYFDIFGRRIWKLITLNLIYLVVSIPAILIAWAISSYLITFLMTLSGTNIVENQSIITIISLFATAILFQVFGSGPATASISYIIRRYIKDSHVWIFSDFFDHIKKNFKQGMAVYIINTFVSAFLVIAYIFYSLIMRNSLGSLMAFIILVVSAFFVMMQMYTYQLMAGFNFKVKDIYKNSFLLTIIKLPWNSLTVATVFLLMYAMYSLALTSPFIAVLVLALIYFVLVSFTQIFMTNNIVKEYVLEPSLKKEEENE